MPKGIKFSLVLGLYALFAWATIGYWYFGSWALLSEQSLAMIGQGRRGAQAFRDAFRYATIFNFCFLGAGIGLTLGCSVVFDSFWGFKRSKKEDFLKSGSKWMASKVFSFTGTGLVSIFTLWMAVGIVSKGDIALNAKEIGWLKCEALVLGTNKYLSDGKTLNLYYLERIQTAAHWYHITGNGLVVSGDNSTMEYNEPLTMKKDLMALGVPENKIRMDFAGFRTLDSMVRFKILFGNKPVVVISQAWHLDRALFIARAYGLAVKGLAAPGKPTWTMRVREFFAKGKVIVDLFFLNEQPRFGKSEWLPVFDYLNYWHWMVLLGSLAMFLLGSKLFYDSLDF